MRVLVLGGGAIGASTAYQLVLRGAEAIVVERRELACAASGKSGGFLARDWCDGSPLMRLARRSYDLHASLAAELDGQWGYRGLTTYAGAIGRERHQRIDGPTLGWIAPDVRIGGQLGSPETTAQVHPAAFTIGMMRAAEARGAELRLGEVTGLLQGGGRVHGAVIDGERIEADAVVIAMGPWSVLAAQWLPLPPVFGLKGHSIVFRTAAPIPPEALFLEMQDVDGTMLSPELFPRSDGTTYVCAISSEPPLPLDPADVVPDHGAIDRLTAVCARISPDLAGARVVTSGACFRPITSDGLPLIGAIPGAAGAYVATGHSVWGILNAPATGEAVAELILDGAARQVDLSGFDPARLPPLDPARLSARASASPRGRPVPT